MPATTTTDSKHNFIRYADVEEEEEEEGEMTRELHDNMRERSIQKLEGMLDKMMFSLDLVSHVQDHKKKLRKYNKLQAELFQETKNRKKHGSKFRAPCHCTKKFPLVKKSDHRKLWTMQEVGTRCEDAIDRYVLDAILDEMFMTTDPKKAKCVCRCSERKMRHVCGGKAAGCNWNNAQLVQEVISKTAGLLQGLRNSETQQDSWSFTSWQQKPLGSSLTSILSSDSDLSFGRNNNNCCPGKKQQKMQELASSVEDSARNAISMSSGSDYSVLPTPHSSFVRPVAVRDKEGEGRSVADIQSLLNVFMPDLKSSEEEEAPLLCFPDQEASFSNSVGFGLQGFCEESFKAESASSLKSDQQQSSSLSVKEPCEGEVLSKSNCSPERFQTYEKLFLILEYLLAILDDQCRRLLTSKPALVRCLEGLAENLKQLLTARLSLDNLNFCTSCPKEGKLCPHELGASLDYKNLRKMLKANPYLQPSSECLDISCGLLSCAGDGSLARNFCQQLNSAQNKRKDILQACRTISGRTVGEQVQVLANNLPSKRQRSSLKQQDLSDVIQELSQVRKTAKAGRSNKAVKTKRKSLPQKSRAPPQNIEEAIKDPYELEKLILRLQRNTALCR